MRCSVSLVWWFAKWCSLPSFAQLDDVRQAYTAALAFLATRTETRFLFARLPPAVRDDIRFSGCKISFCYSASLAQASVSEFQDTIRQALSQSLGRTAVETTIKDIESLLYED